MIMPIVHSAMKVAGNFGFIAFFRREIALNIRNQLIHPFHAKDLFANKIPYHKQSQPSFTQDRFLINFRKPLSTSHW